VAAGDATADQPTQPVSLAGSEAAMRHPAPTPTGSPMPLPRARPMRRRHNAGSVELAGKAIDEFNTLVHQMCVEAPQIDADAIASVARWLDSQPAAQRQELLQSRLDRLAELEAMQNDPDWPLDPAQSHRIQLMLDYVAREDDLIPDQVPVHGHLDDALLLELAWPIFAEDVEDYRDFCRYREEVSTPRQVHAEQSDWLRTRHEEGALWEHMHRVHEQHYVDLLVHVAPFRIT
jgi:uncharacterized membrane protein YkvA (DUF1232 family)